MVKMISRCDECHHLFRHDDKEPEQIVEERITENTALGDAVRTVVRGKIRMRLCNSCIRD